MTDQAVWDDLDEFLSPDHWGDMRGCGGIKWNRSKTVGYQLVTDNVGGATGNILVRKYSGGSWSTVGTAFTEAAKPAAFADWELPGDSGNLIHLAAEMANNTIGYRTLDVSTDTFGTHETAHSVNTGTWNTGNGGFNGAGSISIIKTIGGNVLLLGRATGGTYFRRRTTAGVWASRTSPYEADGEDRAELIPGLMADTNDAFVLYHDDSQNAWSVKFYDDSANTVGAERGCGAFASVDTDDFYWFVDWALDPTENDAIILKWNNGPDVATADLDLTRVPLDSSVSPAVVVTNGTVLTNTADATGAAVMVDGNTGDIGVNYLRGTAFTAMHVYGKWWTKATETMGSEVQFSVSAGDIRDVFLYNGPHDGQDGRWQPVWMVEGTSDVITTSDLGVDINGAGATVVEGAATLSGSGDLSAAGTRIAVSAAALSGAGALAASALNIAIASATLTGAGALAAASFSTIPGAAALSGAGDLAAAGHGITAGAAALSGAGALAADGAVIVHGAAALTGAGALTAASVSTIPASAALAGAGAVSAAGIVIVHGTAALSGAGDASIAGITIVMGAAALSGAGALAADGDVVGAGPQTILGDALLVGTGALSADAIVIVMGAASLSGSGDATASGHGITSGAAALTGNGDISASGQAIVMAAAALSGAGALSVQAAVFVLAASALAGSGALTAGSHVIILAAAALSGVGALTADGRSATDVEGAALLTGQGALTARGIIVLYIEVGALYNPRVNASALLNASLDAPALVQQTIDAEALHG